MRSRQPSSNRASLLAAYARRNRFEMTASEERLWHALAARKLAGVQFRRQTVLAGRFIVDFFAPSASLAVEVDGPYHARHRSADARRDKALGHAGYRVLRFTVEEVMHQLPSVLERIRAEIEKHGR